MPKTAQSAIADELQETGLDLDRIDVDAARDDHVARAVTEVQEAVGVEEADVATGDESVAFDLGARLVLAEVREVRVRPRANEDLAGLPDRAPDRPRR